MIRTYDDLKAWWRWRQRPKFDGRLINDYMIQRLIWYLCEMKCDRCVRMANYLEAELNRGYSAKEMRKEFKCLARHLRENLNLHKETSRMHGDLDAQHVNALITGVSPDECCVECEMGPAGQDGCIFCRDMEWANIDQK